jgi:DNA-binding PadR family transcriptional regulator
MAAALAARLTSDRARHILPDAGRNRLPTTLNHVELLTLVAAHRLADNHAYGVTIQREIAELGGREISMGAVYSALERLERLGLVRPHLSEPRAERGGRARRLFTLTAAGRDSIRHAHANAMRLWDSVSVPKAGKRS